SISIQWGTLRDKTEAMKKCRKDMPQELKTLKKRMKALLRANMGEMRRTMELLRDTERKVEDRFGLLDSLETVWETAGRKFRKKPDQDIATSRFVGTG